MPMRRRTARRAGRRTARRTTRRTVRRRGVVGPTRGVARRRHRRYRRRRIIVGGATMLLVGGAAYKLGQNSVQQVEQHTGKPADQLSEEELLAAMDELGIEQEELTPEDQAAIDAEAIDDAAPYDQAEPDYLDELQRLADLKDKGIITEEEFEAKKKEILGL
jgi:hypothetical protein